MPTDAATLLEPVLRETVLDREKGSPPAAPPPACGDDPPPPRGVATEPPPVSNGRIAMLAFVVFESMLFVTLLGGYTVLRWGSVVWPPPGQPYLPIGITWLNTAVLLASCIPLVLTKRRSEKQGRAAGFKGLLLATAMGSVFLGIQGVEWIRLVSHGLRVANGTYGGTFVMLIGAHGLHVLGAVVWLGIVSLLAARGRLRVGRSTALDLCSIYWYFVCALWILIFYMVYLA